MKNVPEKNKQVIQVHAQLIVAVVQSLHNTSMLPQLQQALKASEENGWKNLVAAIRKILQGNRDASLLKGLDEEDGFIVEAILRGIQNPSTLPDPQQQQDPTLAAPMLAQMIHAAARGDVHVDCRAAREQASRPKFDDAAHAAFFLHYAAQLAVSADLKDHGFAAVGHNIVVTGL